MSGDDRRSDDASDWREQTTSRLNNLEYAVAKNTNITSEIKRNTDDIVEFFQAGQGTIKALRILGIIAKWVTTVAAAVAVAFVLWRGSK